MELFLSDELIFELLIRVPAKTLFRSKCVCKRWRLLISDPSFVRRRKSLPPLTTGLFYHYFNDEKVYFYSDFDNKIDCNVANLSFLQRPISVVASHNGLLLCSEKPNTRWWSEPCRINFFVCNPFTKQWLPLPEQQQHCEPMKRKRLLFNTYHEEDSDQVEFKVVYITSHENDGTKIETYCSEIGEWSVSIISHTLDESVLIHNSVYFWDRFDTCLLIYDLKDQSICDFTELPMCSNISHLGESSGSVYFVGTDETCMCVWVLVEVEWSLVHTIKFESLVNQLPSSLNYGRFFFPYEFLPNHKILLTGEAPPKVFLYHIGTRRIEIMDNIQPGVFPPFIPYSLPAWIPCLKSTWSYAPYITFALV